MRHNTFFNTNLHNRWRQQRTKEFSQNQDRVQKAMSRIIPPYVIGVHPNLSQNTQPIENFDGDGDLILPDGRVLVFKRTLEGLIVQQTFQHPDGNRPEQPYNQCLLPWEKLPAPNISRHAEFQRRQSRTIRTRHILRETAVFNHLKIQGISIFMNYIIGEDITLYISRPQDDPTPVPVHPTLQVVFDTKLLNNIRKNYKDWKLGTNLEISFHGLKNWLTETWMKIK